MESQEFTLPQLRRNLNSSREKKTEGARKVRIRPMDPAEMWGKGTSAVKLYRVEEIIDQTRIHHLVFFDRHAWDGGHGKQCGAGGDVQKFTRNKLKRRTTDG